jgi:epoxyqueuosine reductase
MNPEAISTFIKQEAKALGFLNCGIAKARYLEEEAPRLEQWLKDGKHGRMSYMENHFDKRLDPRKLVDDTKSIISLSLNYFPENEISSSSYLVSKYAYGDDYHEVIKRKLKLLMNAIREKVGDVNGRAFVDSAPVMDKVWAKESGLGWIGKHTNLLSKKQGSFFFLAELLIDIECAYDAPMQTDHCGTCTQCIDACPTQAIVAPYILDASKCISYLTIELKDEFPKELQHSYSDWIFGCDVCQDVCPWNRFSIATNEFDFKPKLEWFAYTKSDWDNLTQESFEILFKHSPIKRTKFEGLKRNIKWVMSNG